MEDKNYIFIEYQNISNRLKKRRILKKPNVAEACQQFENLAATCEAEDLPQYAGMCYQAAANCQNTLGNKTEQANLLLKAYRQFMSSYCRYVTKKMVYTDENYHEALVCYHGCLECYENNQDPTIPDKNVVMARITMEMADTLRTTLKRVEESVTEYERTLRLLEKYPVDRINCLKNLTSAKISLGHYDAALKYTNEIVEECQKIADSGHKEDVLCASEITRILLLLILQPTPQQITPLAASILEKYAWVETVENDEIADLRTTLKSKGIPILDETLFLCLQSLVMACQCGDRESLVTLEDELLQFLSLEQKDLLRTLVRKKLNR